MCFSHGISRYEITTSCFLGTSWGGHVPRWLAGGERGQDPGVQVTDGWRLLASALVGIGPAGGHGGETEVGD